MKLTTVLILIALIQASAKSYSQVTLKEKDAPLEKVLNDIKNQTGYTFIYDEDALTLKSITVDVNNVSLEQALKACFKDAVTFEIVKKTILLQPAESSLFDKIKSKIKAELAQTTVTGKVVDGTSQPIPGVTVKEKGMPNGTVTDNKGNYSLTASSENSIVTFSFIGYEPQELKAKDLPNGSTIILKPQENNLREVVINKGYYNEKQELTTGDVGVVTANTIERQPVTDPIQALIGQVAGLNIQQTSGIPGAYATIHIRGLNSIGNGNDPYYIVDGVPFSSLSLSNPTIQSGALGGGNLIQNNNGSGVSPFNALNPDDIESIEVLKDADATAIYGAKGANGVIIITTKKGKAGETKVSFDVSQGIGQVGHFMDMLNTQQYLQMRRQAFTNDGVPFPSIATNQNDGNYDVDGVWDTTRYTNWQKLLIGGTAQYTNAQGNISGGNANTQFLIGGGYSRQTTVYPGDYEDRKGSLHFSLTNTSSNQKFRAVLSGSYVNDNDVIPLADYSGSIDLAPDAPALYNPDGSLNWQILNGTYTFTNPLGPTVNTASEITNNLVSSLDLSYELLPGLVIKSDFGYNHDELDNTNLSLAAAHAPPYNTNPNFRTNDYSNTQTSGWNIEPQISYRHKIAKGELNVLLGGSLQQSTLQETGAYATGFATDALVSDPQAATRFGPDGDNNSEYRYEALLARVGYIWQDKYILNLTGNRDGSSRFGPGRQFANFGAIGAGWIFSKEKIVQDLAPWLSFGKLRLSYGTTGSDQIGNYGYLSTYSPNSTSYQGVSQLAPTGLANPNFSWEVDKKLEGGLELGFLKDRINLSLSYYRDRTDDQLVGYPLPGIAGFYSVQANLPALVQNSGLEVNLHAINIQSGSFRWSTSATFSLPQNKLLAYPGLAESSYANQYVVGQSLFSHLLFQYTGVSPQTGLYSFRTNNANGLPTYFDLSNEVASDPVTQKYYGMIINDFSYKGFGLSISLQFVDQLQDSYLGYFNKTPGTVNNTFTSNFPTAVLGAWTTQGQTATVERYSTGNPAQYYSFLFSTGRYTDGSFVRIKNARLYYKLPIAWQQWAHMQNTKVYIEGQNLYTFTKYIGLDPETPGLGLPPLRMIVMGISTSF